MKWHLPESDSYFEKFITRDGGFQTDHLLAALEHVKHWNMAVDVGAHVGLWTVPMSERFRRVIGFEMAPDTFESLKKNTEDCHNVQVYNRAVGDKEGWCSPSDDPQRVGNTGSRFVGTGQRVPMVTLDQFNWQNLDFLKVDVEGYEWHVLQGAQRVIQKFWPVIIMETDKKFARDRYDVPDDAAEQFLLSLGYRIVEHMRPDKVFAP